MGLGRMDVILPGLSRPAYLAVFMSPIPFRLVSHRMFMRDYPAAH